jgi:hypothetical protein
MILLELGYMKDRVDQACRRKIQTVCHYSNTFQHNIGFEKLVCNLWKWPIHQRTLGIGLQLQQYLVSYMELPV